MTSFYFYFGKDRKKIGKICEGGFIKSYVRSYKNESLVMQVYLLKPAIAKILECGLRGFGFNKSCTPADAKRVLRSSGKSI